MCREECCASRNNVQREMVRRQEWSAARNGLLRRTAKYFVVQGIVRLKVYGGSGNGLSEEMVCCEEWCAAKNNVQRGMVCHKEQCAARNGVPRGTVCSKSR